MTTYCQFHNINHVTWVMCPRCFDTLLTILNNHCTANQIRCILAVLLGDSGCQAVLDLAPALCVPCSREDEQTDPSFEEDLTGISSPETDGDSVQSLHSLHGEEYSEEDFDQIQDVVSQFL